MGRGDWLIGVETEQLETLSDLLENTLRAARNIQRTIFDYPDLLGILLGIFSASRLIYLNKSTACVKTVAERAGFEPAESLTLRTLSRRVT